VEQMRFENIAPQIDIPSDLAVCVDRDQYHQVLVNMILNSRHAIFPKGSGSIKIYTENKEDGVNLCIKDDGIGMDEETKSMIFTPFFTTKGATQSNAFNIRGTGLGLSVCESIVKSHGGRISLESQTGTGTTFKIFIPNSSITTIVSDPKKSARAEELNISGLKIFVVDDEQDICVPMAKTLSLLGCKDAKAITSPSEALNLIRLAPPDILFLDVMMPGISGLQILDTIKKEKLPITTVLMSGKLDISIDELKTRGAFGFLDKPFDNAEVVNLIGKFMKKKSKM
ncbi:MAG TPA: ATP-binding protein, partial [Victivallales bacterium]|nr:ATP-binding protein [Victivallales bacterium]